MTKEPFDLESSALAPVEKLVFDKRRRAALFALGVILAGLGIACSTQAGLGATPISSVPWVLTTVTPLSYGTLTLCMNLFFVLGQILILRRSFHPFQFLQIPATALFGLCIDLGMFLTRPFITHIYLAQIAFLLFGTALLAAGIVCQILSDFLCVPGDAFVKTFSKTFHVKLPYAKMGFDASLTLIALILSILFCHAIIGIREGTILSVFLVGFFVGIIMPRLRFLRKACFQWCVI